MPATLQPAKHTPANLDSESASAAELDALLHGAAVAPLDEIGWIRVTGSDRTRWLNGMVTNSIATLAPGGGNYNFVLNAQGRIQADLTAFALEDSFLLETADAGKLATLFDHFIIMDDVELEVLRNGLAEIESAAANGYPFLGVSRNRTGLLIAGPQAQANLQAIEIPVKPHSSVRLESANWHTEAVEIIHAHSPIIPRYELWADPATIASLTQALTAAGATPVSLASLEALRILSGTPRYGTDIRNTETARDLPQETAQTHALHFSKGCYLGQEIVERIHSRGNVHRTFSGLLLTGDLPIPGTILTAEGKAVGEITSATLIPLATPIQLALGYIRREALDRNAPLTYPGGIANLVTLPYPALN